MNCKNLSKQNGFALVTVLWAVGLIAVIALVILKTNMRDSLTLLYEQQDRQAKALAIGETQRMMANMIASEPVKFHKAISLQHQGFDIQHNIVITPESGRLDINRADARFIEVVLEQLGLPKTDARDISITIRQNNHPVYDLRQLSLSDDLLAELDNLITFYGQRTVKINAADNILKAASRRLLESEKVNFLDQTPLPDQGWTAGHYRLNQTLTFPDERIFHFRSIIRYRPGFEDPAQLLFHRQVYPY